MTRARLRHRYWRSLTGIAPGSTRAAARPRVREGYSLARRYMAALLNIQLAPRPTRNPPTERAPSPAPAPGRRRRTALLTSMAAAAAVGLGAVTFAALDNGPPPDNIGVGQSPTAAGSVGEPTPTGAVSLADVAPVSAPFQSNDSDPIEDGLPVADFLAQDIGCDPAGEVDYDIGGGFSVFQASLGLDDRSPAPSATPTVKIYGDGRLLGSYTAAASKQPPVPVDVDVTGVSELRFIWAYPVRSGASAGRCRPLSTLIIGNPVLTAAATG